MAIEALDTYPAATKLPHTDKVLTPIDTSYSVPVGVHDGTETVSIQTESMKTVTPNTSVQSIEPDDPDKFLGIVRVNGVSARGYKVFRGTITPNGGTTISVSGFNFTAKGMVVVNTGTSNSSAITNGQASTAPYSLTNYYAAHLSIGRVWPRSNAISSYSFGYNVASITCDSGSAVCNGSYRYLVWGT